jgi:hypothetical protein
VSDTDRQNAVALAALAIVIAIVGSRAARALSFPEFSSFVSLSWYFRLRVFEIRNEVLALGAMAYALPRTRTTAAALRVAAVLGVIGVAAEVAEWMLERVPHVPAVSTGVGSAVGHLGAIVALGAVVAMWYFREYRFVSDEVAAADLA